MVKKRKYQQLYSGLFGPKKNYIDDVPMYGPTQRPLDRVPSPYSPGQFPQPTRGQPSFQAYDPNAWINPEVPGLPQKPGDYVYQNMPSPEMQRRQADWEQRQKFYNKNIGMNRELEGATPAEQRGMGASYRSSRMGAEEGLKREQKEYEANLKNEASIQAKKNIRDKWSDIPPNVAGAIDRITGDMDTRPNPNPGFPGYKPPSKWPKTPKDSPLFPNEPVGPEEPIGNLPVQPPVKPAPEPVQPIKQPRPAPGLPGSGGGGLVPGGGVPIKPDIVPTDPDTGEPIGPEPGYEPPPPPGLDPNNFPMAPGTEPEPTIAGVKPSDVTIGGADGDIPDGVVTADTKTVMPRIRDARDQVYTPRSILAPAPREPQLTKKWPGAQYEKIPEVGKYGEPLPNVPKLDPGHQITRNRRIQENVPSYQQGNRMPDIYGMDGGPQVGDRERVTPATLYGEERPKMWDVTTAPDRGQYDRVQGGGRFGEDRPRGYDTPDSPTIERPERMGDPRMYDRPLPEQMGMRDIPLPGEYGKVDIGAGFDKAIPGQEKIGAAPTSREKDFDYRKLGTPESVGRMRDRVWRPEMKEADYTDIKGPEKMAALKDAQLGKFDELAQWDKGKQGVYKRQVYEGDRGVGNRAALADAARSIFSQGKDFRDAASTAVGQERDRQQVFEQRQDQREQTYSQLQQADRQQRLAEQQFKFGLQKQISDQGIQVRGQDLDYIKEGARLGMQEFQTRLTERMGHNADKLKFNDSLIAEAQNFNQADQAVQAKNIEAAQADRGLAAQYAQQDNQATTAKIGAQQAEDRLDFDKWAKTQDLTQDQYSKALNAWSLEQQAKYGQQTLGVDAQKFNIQAAQKQYDQALNAWTNEEGAKDARFGKALQAHQEGRATLQDYQVLKQKQEEFNSGAGQEYQKMLQQQYRDVSGVAGQKARFGLDSWQAGQGAEEQYQQRQLQAQQFNVGTDIKKFDQDLSRWDKTMGYTSQNFNDSMQRWKEGRANDHDMQVLRFAQEKQNIDDGNTKFNQKLDVWDKTLGHKSTKFKNELDKWKTGADDHYKFLEEKRLRFGLNEKEQRSYDELGLQKWQIEQHAKDTNFDSNLDRWNKGLDLHKFQSEEERQRFQANNDQLYKADANAINKYGHDIDLWNKYNKLPSDIRKDEAMADNYMNWYAQEQMKIKGQKEATQDPLKMANYYDNFNKDWTSSKAWKDYEESGKAFDKIVSAPATGFGDMSAIYGFIKSIDPMTGVREGERDFAVSAMGWLKDAESSGAIPSFLARKAKNALTGELMLPEDRELLAKAALEATNVTRQTYYNSLGQHENTWRATDVLRDNTDRIMKLPDYFGEKDKYGRKLDEPTWQAKLRQKYADQKNIGFKPKPTNNTTAPEVKPTPAPSNPSNPWGNFGPNGQPAPIGPKKPTTNKVPLGPDGKPNYDDPSYDPTDDFNKAFPKRG